MSTSAFRNWFGGRPGKRVFSDSSKNRLDGIDMIAAAKQKRISIEPSSSVDPNSTLSAIITPLPRSYSSVDVSRPDPNDTYFYYSDGEIQTIPGNLGGPGRPHSSADIDILNATGKRPQSQPKRAGASQTRPTPRRAQTTTPHDIDDDDSDDKDIIWTKSTAKTTASGFTSRRRAEIYIHSHTYSDTQLLPEPSNSGASPIHSSHHPFLPLNPNHNHTKEQKQRPQKDQGETQKRTRASEPTRLKKANKSTKSLKSTTRASSSSPSLDRPPIPKSKSTPRFTLAPHYQTTPLYHRQTRSLHDAKGSDESHKSEDSSKYQKSAPSMSYGAEIIRNDYSRNEGAQQITQRSGFPANVNTGISTSIGASPGTGTSPPKTTKPLRPLPPQPLQPPNMSDQPRLYSDGIISAPSSASYNQTSFPSGNMPGARPGPVPATAGPTTSSYSQNPTYHSNDGQGFLNQSNIYNATNRPRGASFSGNSAYSGYYDDDPNQQPTSPNNDNRSSQYPKSNTSPNQQGPDYFPLALPPPPNVPPPTAAISSPNYNPHPYPMSPPTGARYANYNNYGGRPTHNPQDSKGSYGTHGTHGSSAGSAADLYLGLGNTLNYNQPNSTLIPPYSAPPYMSVPNTPRKESIPIAEKNSGGRTSYELNRRNSPDFLWQPQGQSHVQAPSTATSAAIAIAGTNATAAIAPPASATAITFGSASGFGRPSRVSESGRPYGSGRPSDDFQTSIAPPSRRQRTEKPLPPTHAALSLNRTDRVRMIKFPNSAVESVRQAILGAWPKGVQFEKEASGSTELQLRGNPWSGQGDEAIPAIYTMCQIMSALYHLGWTLIMATDISKRAMDKDTLIFRHGDIPPPCSFMGISFNEGDKLRLIKAPNDVINVVKNVWGGNVQSEKWKLEGTAWEFKIAGNPWWSAGDESISVRILLLNMLDALNAMGWTLHSSLDMTAGPGGLGKNAGADTDCWILRKQAI